MTELIDFIKQQGIFRRKSIKKNQHSQLRKLYETGQVMRLSKGLYASTEFTIDEHFSLIQTVKAVPKGTICLLSALHFHHLTTQLPFKVWLAVPPNTSIPKDIPIHYVQFSGQALETGREFHILNGVPVPIYNPAKTVADCFKHRNKIGLDIALEALKNCWSERRCTMQELYEYAEICKVKTVMQPYLEFLAI
ncbi:type IV toxin-antitoxin system AbiEi family antitoxin domain-containing protein [Thioflexithrix psekupsensis]|nr:hypothetical protein [Thioflexithrix psekupsensis]